MGVGWWVLMGVDGGVVVGEHVVVGVVPRRPKIPGLRWWRGSMALKRWVIIVAPAVIAAVASSYVDSVWPMLKMMLWGGEVRVGMREVMCGSSGAAVIRRILPSRLEAP